MIFSIWTWNWTRKFDLIYKSVWWYFLLNRMLTWKDLSWSDNKTIQVWTLQWFHYSPTLSVSDFAFGGVHIFGPSVPPTPILSSRLPLGYNVSVFLKHTTRFWRICVRKRYKTDLWKYLYFWWVHFTIYFWLVKAEQDAFESRRCVKEHSKKTLVNPGRIN